MLPHTSTALIAVLLLSGCQVVNQRETPAMYEIQQQLKSFVAERCVVKNDRSKDTKGAFISQLKFAANNSGWVRASARDSIDNIEGDVFYNFNFNQGTCTGRGGRPTGVPTSWREMTEYDAENILGRSPLPLRSGTHDTKQSSNIHMKENGNYYSWKILKEMNGSRVDGCYAAKEINKTQGMSIGIASPNSPDGKEIQDQFVLSVVDTSNYGSSPDGSTIKLSVGQFTYDGLPSFKVGSQAITLLYKSRDIFTALENQNTIVWESKETYRLDLPHAPMLMDFLHKCAGASTDYPDKEPSESEKFEKGFERYLKLR